MWNKKSWCTLLISDDWLYKITYTPQSHSPQRYKHLEAAGFRRSPAASFVLCLCKSRIWGRCSGARTGFHRCESIDGCWWVRDWRGFCGVWWCGLHKDLIISTVVDYVGYNRGGRYYEDVYYKNCMVAADGSPIKYGKGNSSVLIAGSVGFGPFVSIRVYNKRAYYIK